jgi:hypothetical protein
MTCVFGRRDCPKITWPIELRRPEHVRKRRRRPSLRISRRHLLAAAPAAAESFGCALLASRAYADAIKAPKSAVRYQGGPKGDQSCGLCANFLPPSDCRVVASPVAPGAWCLLFQSKSSGE